MTLLIAAAAILTPFGIRISVGSSTVNPDRS
jgi:hypothetical protein